MNTYLARATRVLAVLVAVVLAFTALPAMFVGQPAVQNAAAAENIVKIGWLNFDVIYWNPLMVDMVEDYVAYKAIFSCLYTYDQDWNNTVPDLALDMPTQEVFDNGTPSDPSDDWMRFTLEITQNGYWRNAANPTDTTHPVTAADVVYTIEMMQSHPDETWDFYLRDINNTYAVGDYTVVLETANVTGILVEDLAEIPIVPKYMWETISFNQQVSGQMKPSWLVGSGPFAFADKSSGWVKFVKMPNYHGAADYGDERTVKVDSLLFSTWGDAGAMVLELNAGNLDAVWMNGEPGLWRDTLGDNPSVNIIKHKTNLPGICDIAINAIPIDNRTTTYGQGFELLLDPIVRQAILMTLNKDYIRDVILFGFATKADSVTEPGFWHKDILNELPYDPAAAKDLLMANGYDQDADGDGFLEANDQAYPVVMGWADAGTELSGIRCHAPDTDPSYGLIALAWKGWAADAGISLDSAILQESVMTNSEWYKAMYDIWVWHWGWGGEPLIAALPTWLWEEMEPGGDNCQMPMGNPPGQYDQIYYQALKTLDRNERRDLVFQLQQIVHDSWCESPPYYDLGLYGMTDARYTGWGDQDNHSGLNIESGLQWIWFSVTPQANRAPSFDQPLQPTYQVQVNTSLPLQVTVSDWDGDMLYVNWTFGDGNTTQDTLAAGTTATPTVVSQTHVYDTVSFTGYALKVDLWDGLSNHQVSSTSVVVVVPVPDTGPTIDSMTYTPNPQVTPVYEGEWTTWTCVAHDAEAQDYGGLTITWDWGDGTYNSTNHPTTQANESVTDIGRHYWANGGMWTITLWVWDGFDVNTNPLHNVSTSPVTYEISINQPPTAPVVSAMSGIEGEWILGANAYASDPEGDPLTFTWDWGNSSYNVTTGDAGPDVDVYSYASHIYSTAGNYKVIVHVDDGLPGHNVSAQGLAVIEAAGANLPPTGLTITWMPIEPVTPAFENFTASATDADGEVLTFYIEYGDGGSETNVSDAGGTGVQTVGFMHRYLNAGTYLVNISADDGTDIAGHNVSVQRSVRILAPPVNQPPELVIQSSYTPLFNQTFSIAPVSVSDPDGDSIAVWFDWGDDSPMTKGDPANVHTATHVYHEVGQFTLTVYADDGTGEAGHNVSDTATVTVLEANFKPSIVSFTKSPSATTYLPGTELTFTVVVRDTEGDVVTVTINFGDGSTNQTQTADTSPNADSTMTFTHTYEVERTTPYTVTVTVKDSNDHSDMTPASSTLSVTIQAEEEGGGISGAMIAGIVILIVVVLIIVAVLLMRRKKGAAGEAGGMEGMAPPESPPPPPS